MAKTLRLSGSDLKRQRERLDKLPSMTPVQETATSQAVFVPVEVSQTTATPAPGADIEIHRADGARLCVRYAERAPVAEVLRAFLEV